MNDMHIGEKKSMAEKMAEVNRNSTVFQFPSAGLTSASMTSAGMTSASATSVISRQAVAYPPANTVALPQTSPSSAAISRPRPKYAEVPKSGEKIQTLTVNHKPYKIDKFYSHDAYK